MIHKFAESEEVAKKNAGREYKSIKTLSPYLVERGFLIKFKSPVKKINYSCKFCGEKLNSSYTRDLGVCVTCWYK